MTNVFWLASWGQINFFLISKEISSTIWKHTFLSVKFKSEIKSAQAWKIWRQGDLGWNGLMCNFDQRWNRIDHWKLDARCQWKRFYILSDEENVERNIKYPISGSLLFVNAHQRRRRRSPGEWNWEKFIFGSRWYPHISHDHDVICFIKK